ncbi:MAG: type II secretion system protein [Elusimicrobiaceae bacterium]|nr:type II secretion system protein [Elusimicrobiaceae bacterium]
MAEKKSCTQGFTLIELLVVVLIIGILASVAVPQYQRAVDKAWATEAVLQGRALQNALVLYYQSTGEFSPTDLEVLPWEIPEKLQWTYSDGHYATAVSQRSGAKFEVSRYYSDSYLLWCRATGERSKKMCEQFGTLHHSGDVTFYYLIHRAYLY